MGVAVGEAIHRLAQQKDAKTAYGALIRRALGVGRRNMQRVEGCAVIGEDDGHGLRRLREAHLNRYAGGARTAYDIQSEYYARVRPADLFFAGGAFGAFGDLKELKTRKGALSYGALPILGLHRLVA